MEFNENREAYPGTETESTQELNPDVMFEDEGEIPEQFTAGGGQENAVQQNGVAQGAYRQNTDSQSAYQQDIYRQNTEQQGANVQNTYVQAQDQYLRDYNAGNGTQYGAPQGVNVQNASRGFEKASLVLGIIAVAGFIVFIVSAVCGSLAIIFGLLSRGSDRKLRGSGKTGFVLGLIGICASLAISFAALLYLASLYGGFDNLFKLYSNTYDQYYDDDNFSDYYDYYYGNDTYDYYDYYGDYYDYYWNGSGYGNGGTL